MSQIMQNPKNKFRESVEDARGIGSEEQNRSRDWVVRMGRNAHFQVKNILDVL